MKIFREFVEKKQASSLFSKLFAVRDHAHQLHLNTKSYAEHKALDGFYNGLLELMDTVIETYQGEHELVDIKPNEEGLSEDPVQFLKDFAAQIKTSRKMFEENSHLQNLMDEISTLTYQTLYKLRFLK